MIIATRVFKYESSGFTRTERKLGSRRSILDLNGLFAAEPQNGLVVSIADEQSLVFSAFDSMRRPAVVEPRVTNHPETQVATHRFDSADQIVLMPKVGDWHEIRHFGHAIV